jgi:hypothetical protein
MGVTEPFLPLLVVYPRIYPSHIPLGPGGGGSIIGPTLFYSRDPTNIPVLPLVDYHQGRPTGVDTSRIPKTRRRPLAYANSNSRRTSTRNNTVT